MKNLSNSVTLMGNLGRDVELITLDSGSKIAKTSIATNRFYTNSNGEKVQDVEWHNLIAWNRTAELMEKLLHKGSRVVIQGTLRNETYKNKDGEIKYATNVRINEFQKITERDHENT